MKSLRKSLNGNKDSIRAQISTPLPLPAVSKPPAVITPPQKVIRALAAYRPQAPQELPFQKGDFFYVLRDVEKQGAWYEAHNPVSGARGLVPRSMFEEFSKSPPSRLSQVGGKSPLANLAPPRPDLTHVPRSPKTQVFYAVVLHDFIAERADELDAKRGDPISVVAQSNREWFVAKPIGRLGRPGLIPVAFVEIRDPATNQAVQDVYALMDRGDLPKVEDWKKAMFDYKQNSIALGVIEDSQGRMSVPNSPFTQQNPPPELPKGAQAPAIFKQEQQYTNIDPLPRESTPDLLPPGILLHADVVSFHFEMDEYWFRIDAMYQPYPSPGSSELPSARQLILFRVYNDFYDFQVSLLDTFPREAGRQPPHPRVLPYMPGPADEVDDEITAARRAELDEYLHKLCDLNGVGAKYVLEHEVVREFLSLKPGDVENPTDPRLDDMEALFGTDFPGARIPQYAPTQMDYASEVRDKLTSMRIVEQDEETRSDGSEYEDEGYATSPQQQPTERERHPYAQSTEHKRPSQAGDSHTSMTLRQHAHAHNHQRTGSTSSFHRASSPITRSSRSVSPMPEHSNSSHLSNNYSSSRAAPGRALPETEPNRSSDYMYSRYENNPPSPTSMRSSQPPSTRSRSNSTAASKLNTPTISAANPQTAFVKIKIFNRVADDLIAIRVHPRVTHAELMDKVHARLGGEVANLRYRDSGSNAFMGIDGDDGLRDWLEGTDKHVLYAD